MAKVTKYMSPGSPHSVPCITKPALRIAAFAFFVSSLAFSSALNVAYAANSDPQQNAISQAAKQSEAKTRRLNSEKMDHSPQAMAKRVEERINILHDKLAITNEQEEKWGDVAETMRNNEARIAEMIEERHQKAADMNAIDDLQSYQDITQEHADGIDRMIEAFESLYSDMSDEQKKVADRVFGRFEGRGGEVRAKKHQ